MISVMLILLLATGFSEEFTCVSEIDGQEIKLAQFNKLSGWGGNGEVYEGSCHLDKVRPVPCAVKVDKKNTEKIGDGKGVIDEYNRATSFLAELATKEEKKYFPEYYGHGFVKMNSKSNMKWNCIALEYFSGKDIFDLMVRRRQPLSQVTNKK